MDAQPSTSALPRLAARAVPAPWTRLVPLVTLALLVLLPWGLGAIGLDYYVGFARRILIVVLAVAALDLIVGGAGLVSLGQAAFMGVGAYALAAGFSAGLESSWSLWLLATFAGGFFAALVGVVALRTRGVYFIMITLAFGQMLYYLAVTLRLYGGDDGYTLERRPPIGWGLSLDDDATFYWVVLAIVAAGWWLLQRVLASPMGHVMRAARDNEARTSALGFPVFITRLAALTLAGAMAGLAGALMLTHNGFVSPASMRWSSSATLLVMLVIGGTGRRGGAVIGVVLWMVAEEVLRQSTAYWHAPLGALLVAVAVLAPRGLGNAVERLMRRRATT